MPNRDVRAELQAIKDARERSEREFFEKLDYSSLTALALSAAETKRADDAARKAAAEEEQGRLRDRWAKAYIERMAPSMTEYFAKSLKIDPESPLLAELKWRINPADFENCEFVKTETGIKPQALVERRTRFYPLTDIDLITIQATPGYIDDELATATFSTFDGTGSSAGVGSLASLGAAIEAARAKAADADDKE